MAQLPTVAMYVWFGEDLTLSDVCHRLNSRQYLAEKHGADRSEIVFDDAIGSLKTSTLPSSRTHATTNVRSSLDVK